MSDTAVIRRPAAPPPRLFTIEEAAPMLRMSRAKLYKLVKGRKVPYRRIAGTGRPFFAQADIDQILEDAHRPAVA